MRTMINYTRRSLIMTAVVVAAMAARAQSDTVRFLNELIKIEGVYTNTEFLRYESDYYYREVDSITEIKDTLQFATQLHGEKFRLVCVTPSHPLSLVQNDQYRVTFYESDSTMLIERSSPFYKKLFDVDFYDEQLRQMNIANITLSDSANIRHISITGLPQAAFATYDIYYDTTTYYLTRIQYTLRKQTYYAGGPHANPDLVSVKVLFHTYTVGSFSDETFDTELYFTRKNGAFVPSDLYTQAEIIDLTNQE